LQDKGRRSKRSAWYRDTETYLQIVLFLIILGVLYIFISGALKGWQGVWVLINVIGGYIILQNPKMRKMIHRTWRGLLIPKVWGLALLNLSLIAISVILISVMISGGGGSGGGGGGNPFVSNILLVVVMFPIIPLFADAETHLFQAMILKIFLKDDFKECPRCKKPTPPGVPCGTCSGAIHGNKLTGGIVWIAIIISAFIFALAHMVLLMSFVPILLMIGGILLGWAYVKKGHLYAAQVHLVYDLILIVMIFFSMLSDLGGIL
jgi:hypothetical protein